MSFGTVLFIVIINVIVEVRSVETPAFQQFHAALIEKYGSIDKVPQELKDRFLAGSRPLMPFTNFLSFNSRAILIYVTCLLNCPWIYFVFEISLYICCTSICTSGTKICVKVLRQKSKLYVP